MKIAKARPISVYTGEVGTGFSDMMAVLPPERTMAACRGSIDWARTGSSPMYTAGAKGFPAAI